MKDVNNPGDFKKRGLSSLESKLYSRSEDDGLQKRVDDLQKLGVREKVEVDGADKDKSKVTYRRIEEERLRRRKKIILGAVAGTVLLAIFVGSLIGTIWYRDRLTVKAEQIGLTLDAPTGFTAGDEVTYSLKVRNDSYVDWQNVEITFEDPPAFSFSGSSYEWQEEGRQRVLLLGNLNSKEEVEISITGRLLGEFNATPVARAVVAITPENFPSGRFEKEAIVSTTITSVPLEAALEMAQEAVPGERIAVSISVTNTTTATLDNVFVRLQPAAGMQVAVEDPQFSAGFNNMNGEWIIPRIASQETVRQQAILYVDGRAGEKRVLQVQTGIISGDASYVQRTVSGVVAVASSEVDLEQTFNGAQDTLGVKAGDRIDGIVKYSNAGTAGLKDVIIRTSFDGVAFNASKLKLDSGAYDPNTKTITWTAASVPDLALLQPNQQGQIEFSFYINETDVFPEDVEEGKNNVLVITTSVDSPTISASAGEKQRVISDRFVMSVSSDLSLSVDAFYDDGRMGLTSTGPLPPEVGEATLYTLRFRLGSTLNDVGDVRMVAVLPDGVSYTGSNVVTVGELKYNDRAGELDWSVPIVSGLSGRALPAAEMYVQVSITPAENQRGQYVSLLNKLEASGTDVFTEAVLDTKILKYPTTEEAVPGKGKVQ